MVQASTLLIETVRGGTPASAMVQAIPGDGMAMPDASHPVAVGSDGPRRSRAAMVLGYGAAARRFAKRTLAAPSCPNRIDPT